MNGPVGSLDKGWGDAVSPAEAWAAFELPDSVVDSEGSDVFFTGVSSEEIGP